MRSFTDLQDFKKVNEYSSALFRICSQLKFCGQSVTDADMLEKTYSTFHASNMTLQQQYRLQKFTRYSELNAYLLVAEQNNELLMKNHQSHPTGSLAYTKVNDTKNDPKSFTRGQGQRKTAEFILMVADSPVVVVKEPTKMLHETIRPKMWASASIMVNLAHRRTMMVPALDVVAQTTRQSLVEQPLTSVSCIKHLLKKNMERLILWTGTPPFAKLMSTIRL
ncbi:hypothetical protein Tco_1465143 [Tanacetum coccineum]